MDIESVNDLASQKDIPAEYILVKTKDLQNKPYKDEYEICYSIKSNS